MTRHVVIDNDARRPAQVWEHDGDAPIAFFTQRADAHLFVAAPCLLQALRPALAEWEFRRETEANRNKDVTPQWVYDARAALAKASPS